MTKPELRNPISGRSRLGAQLNGKLDKALLSYVAAATAAGVGAMIAAQPAEAEVVYTPAHAHLSGTFYLDLNHDGVNDFKFVLAHSSRCQGLCTTSSRRIRHDTAFTSQHGELNVYGLSSNQVFGEGSVASALRVGARIGPDGKFPGGNKMVSASDINSYTFDLAVNGPWKEASFGSNTIRNHFVGFKFLIKGEVHFGWARFNVSTKKGANVSATLTGYAYETVVNKPIRTFDLPPKTSAIAPAALDHSAQPTSLGLLARGVDSLAVWRRRTPAVAE